MKSCSTVRHSVSLASLIESLDGLHKVKPHCKRKLSLKPRLQHRQDVCKRRVHLVNARHSLCTSSSENGIPLLQPCGSSYLNIRDDDTSNEILVTKLDDGEQSPFPHRPLLEDTSNDAIEMFPDRDTPLSKLIDAFLENIDSELKVNAAQCHPSTEDENDLEISLCSVNSDVFPLDDEDTTFSRIFTKHESDCNPQSRKVKFAPEKDRVFEIPSHRTFNEVEKLEIWNNSDAIRLQAFRNYAEWIWEGRVTANVVEEEGFCRDRDGNLLHPAHWVDETRPLADTE